MSKKCLNCGKPLPKGSDLDFCSKECLEQYRKRERAIQAKRTIKDECWLGQSRRKRAVEVIIELAKQNLPMSFKEFACLVSYKTGLSLRKITDDYLEVLLNVGVLKEKGGILSVAEESEKSG